MAKSRKESRPALTRDTVLEHLAAHPGDTKRDLVRALGVKGAERQVLKEILAELAEQGAVARGRRRSYVPAGGLPDMAVLEIFGEDPDGEPLARPVEWDDPSEPPAVLVLPGRDEVSAPGRGERILARISRHKTDGHYEARIVKRLGASAHRALGVLKIQPGELPRVDPVDRKSRHAFMLDRNSVAGLRDGDLVTVEPEARRGFGGPKARIVERHGSICEPRSISLIAIHAHGIPTGFPGEALAEAEHCKPASTSGRTDLRKVPLVTIDPEDARDHDDAVWAGPDPDPRNKGGHIVIVAIADVAHYVRSGSVLEKEALKRGNSVYFPDRVVPMLPDALSADLCSLREAEDRPCLAVRMIFDGQGAKRRHEFLRAVMRSAARLTYGEAQRAFDGKPDENCRHLQAPVLQPLWQAYRTLARERDRRSPLDLDLPERRIVFGPDGHIASVAFRERLESMRLIEEFMIMANVAAAESLEKARQPLIYRIHEEPSREKLVAFGDYLRSIGLSFAKGQVIKPTAFNRILARAKGTPQEEVINEVTLRTQAQAVYAAENIGHFGLNLARYAHFTSPIRRYADLVVHRGLIRALKLGDGGLADGDVGRLSEIAEHVSMTERRAMAAERDSTDRYLAAYMQDRVGAVFTGRISGVTRFGLFVRLAETGADGLLPIRSLGLEFFNHDEKRHALVGDRSGTTYKLGDTISVRLAEAAPVTGGLRFELAEEEGWSNTAPPGQRHGRGHPPRGRGRQRSEKRGTRNER
ncbi:MAG TPA: ribonuclease R [Micropepsaceae bacterium]|nr:ribonuclease R [Micropepsaceae bacterium]